VDAVTLVVPAASEVSGCVVEQDEAIELNVDLADEGVGRGGERLDGELGGEVRPERGVMDGAEGTPERHPLSVGHSGGLGALTLHVRVEDDGAEGNLGPQRAGSGREWGNDLGDTGIDQRTRDELTRLGDGKGSAMPVGAELEEEAGAVGGADLVDSGVEVEAEGDEGDR